MAIGGRCGTCHEPIIMLVTANGARMPVELTSCRPDDDEQTLYDPSRHKSHWANCPGSNRHRKKKRR